MPGTPSIRARFHLPDSLLPPGPTLEPASDDCRRIGQVLARVGDKWSVLLIMLLTERPYRFNELKRRVGGISQRMLALTLKGLERDGLVTLTPYPTVPPRVDYALTPLGASLACPVVALGSWARANLDEIDRARDAYDRSATEASPLPARRTSTF